MSTPTSTSKKHGGTFRAILWALGLAGLLGFAGYVGTLAISSLLGYSAGGEILVGQLLQQFGYTNASHIVVAEGLNNFYQSQIIPYVGTLISSVIGFVIGYFKGKSEDKNESG